MGNQDSSLESKVYYTPISPKIYFKPSFDLSRPIGSESLHEKKNYGFLPLGVIHNLLLYLEPKELYNCLCTCKLLSEVGRTNKFWKDYYFAYFEKSEAEERKKRKLDGESCFNENINWKVKFYEQFSFLSDDFYRFYLNLRRSKTRVRIPPSFKFEKYRKRHKYEILVVGPSVSRKEDLFLHVIKEFLISYDRNKVVAYSDDICDIKVKRGLGVLYKQDFVDIHVRLQNYKTRLDDSELQPLRLNPKFWGILLCFSIHERKSFENSLKIYKKVLKENSPGLDRSTMCLLVGINRIIEGSKKKKKKKELSEEESEEEEEEEEYEEEKETKKKKKKIIGIDEIEKHVITNEFLGYVECEIEDIIIENDEKDEEEEEEDVIQEVRNGMLSFGLLLDNVIRRGNSISDIQSKLMTGEIEVGELKEKMKKQQQEKKKRLYLLNKN